MTRLGVTYKWHSTISDNSMNEMTEVNAAMIDAISKKVQGLVDDNTCDVCLTWPQMILLSLLSSEEQIYNECLNAPTMSLFFTGLLARSKQPAAIQEDLLKTFVKADMDFTKTLLLSRKPFGDQMAIEYCEEDYRLIERIGRWEAKIKDGVDINEALRKDTHGLDAEKDEIVQEKEQKAKAFVEKVHRDTMERHIRFKVEAEKRLKELQEEEKNKDKIKQKELLEAVRKRQHENILKLQEVIEI